MVSLATVARNNAEWCDVVCKQHNVPGVFKPDFWVNINQVPSYYPNLVTLSEKVGNDEILDVLGVNTGKLSIKDSFNKLDLANAGFKKLFKAQWLIAPKQLSSGIAWSVVSNETELTKWQQAWDAKHTGLFTPQLLSQNEVKFISIYDKESTVAGAILNKTDELVGLTNIFCNTENKKDYWTAIVVAANSLFPNADIVGYEHGDELELALNIGFQQLGPLCVWIKNQALSYPG